jgi:hypothetical protein
LVDKGAAGPVEIARGLSSLGILHFLVTDSGYCAQVRPVLAQLGPVWDIDDAVLTRARELAPDALVTFSELMLPDASRLASALSLPFHDDRTVEALTNKFVQRTLLREAGVDMVNSEILCSPEDWSRIRGHIDLPVVIKPVLGNSSRNTYKLDNDAMAVDLLRGLFEAERQHANGDACFVVEQYLVGADYKPFGDYVSVECVVTYGTFSLIAITGKFPLLHPFRELGQFWPSALTAEMEAAVGDLAVDALRALGVTTGICHVEVKLTEDGPRIIEVNGRLGAFIGELSRLSGGPDLVEVAGRAALGERVRLAPTVPDAVYFQYWNPAPTHPCRLLTVRGTGELRRHKGVLGYRPFIRPGYALTGGVTTERMDMTEGRVGTHDELARLVDHLPELVSFTFAADRGEFEVTGLDLRSASSLEEAREGAERPTR